MKALKPVPNKPALALLLAATLGPAHAQDAPDTLRLTLRQAVDRALAASASLRQLRALEDAASADAQAARAGRLPAVDLAAGYTRNSDVPELTLQSPGQPPRTIFPNIPDNYRSRLGVSVPVWTGGRLLGQIRAADNEQAAAGSDAQAGVADLVVETTAAYWSLVTARQSESVLAEALAAYDAHLNDARNREAVGMAASNEVLAVQVERDAAELSRLRAANQAAVAEANLARLLVTEAGTRIEAAEPLERAEAEHEALEALVAAALSARPERAALLRRVAAADARVRAEQAGRRPQVVASAGYDYANPNRKILPPEAEWNDTWDIGIGLSLSPFDGGRTRANVARARARADAARAQLQDLDRRIRLQVTQRLLELETAAAQASLAERSLESARENRRVANDRYREGLVPSSELLDAEIALLRAGLERTNALAQVRLAAAQLDRAVGR
jgi:outer membrane protein TolC